MYPQLMEQESGKYVELARFALELSRPPEQPPTYSPGELHLRQALYELSELFFEEVRAHGEQRVRADIDKITGTRSQRACKEELRGLIRDAHNHATPLAVAFIDLDNFKRVNDEVGYEVGDKLLKKVGQVLLDITRRDDYVWRDGGDEFKVALPEFGKERSYERSELRYSMQRVGNKIRDVVNEAIAQEEYARKLELGASLGIGLLEPDDDMDSFCGRIEEAMKQDKKMRKSI